MAIRKQPGRAGAEVDYLVDENGSVVDVEDESLLVQSDDIEESVGATAPTAWWRLGLVALGVIIAVLLVLQLLGGNAGSAPAGPASTETPPISY